MDVVHVNVPLRTGKKMKKRKELDALVANSLAKRSCMNGNSGNINIGGINHTNNGQINKRCNTTTAGNGISSQDQLLSDYSTDEQEAYWNNLNDTKRQHHRNAIHHSLTRRRRTILSMMRACTALLVFTCVVATITVMWLLIDVREQITSLRSELDQVVASNQGVPEALQKCHSVSRILQQNQTQLSTQLQNVRQQLENITQQVNEIKNGLNQVQLRLKENPDLVNIPKQVSSLSNSVAGFGSQMKDVLNTVQSLKDQNNKFTTINNDILQNITLLQNSVQHLSQLNTSNNNNNLPSKILLNETQEFNHIATEIQANLSSVNETLSKQIQWISNDYYKDHPIIIGLQEMNQSILARVASLEVICDKTMRDQNTSLTMINNLSQMIMESNSKLKTSETDLMTLQAHVRDLSAKESDLNKTVNELKNKYRQSLVGGLSPLNIPQQSLAQNQQLPPSNNTPAVLPTANTNSPPIENITAPSTVNNQQTTSSTDASPARIVSKPKTLTMP